MYGIAAVAAGGSRLVSATDGTKPVLSGARHDASLVALISDLHVNGLKDEVQIRNQRNKVWIVAGTG